MNITFNLSDDILNQLPELQLIWNRLEDKEVKVDINKLLWGFLLDIHPKSAYRNLDTVSRRTLIEQDYLETVISWEEFSEEINLIKEMCLSKKERFLIEWENKLNERQEFINKLPYNQENYELLDKMMGATDKMWKQYISCLKDVEEEESLMFGGAQESLSELKLI